MSQPAEHKNSKNDRDASEATIRRRLIGFFMFPVALFPLLALVSYNWRDISALCVPPASPTSNLIGVAGAWFAYYGYQLIGLAIWFVPLLCVFAGLLLVMGHALQIGRRAVATLLFILSATCLLQLVGHTATVTALLHALNIAPNAGGAVGYLVMTRGLARLLSPFGSGVLMLALALYALLFGIGFRTIIGVFARLTAWASDGDDVGDAMAGDAAKQDPEQIRAALAASREEAKAQRLAEKQRIADEKAAAKAEREAAREEARRLREEQRQQKEAEKQRKAAELEAARQRVVQDFLPAREAPAAPSPLAAPPAAKPAPAKPKPAAKPAAPEPVEPPKEEEPAREYGPYELPPVTLLHEVPPKPAGVDDPEHMAQRLIDTLRVFDINAQLAFYIAGPVVTQYALTLDLGTRVEKVANLQRNIQMALQAKSLRIEAPIPGKNAVGIEVPNAHPCSVCFREIIDGEIWQKNSPEKFQVPLLLGKDAAGNDLVADLAKLPHLLVAGATGQGKSVCLNSIINGLLMCRTPEQLRLIMVDPKRVEFTSYQKLPHLLVPIINDTNKVVFALRAALVEMDKRLKLFARANCRNIVDYNTRKTITQPDMFTGEEKPVGGDSDMPRTIPYIVIIIDEVADIMSAAKKEVEPVIARLTALARATGIHLILATQRPDTNIITGVIKSNIPGRIAFKTSSSIDSRTILDATGSELLIGRGDMLFKMSDGRLLRAQGSYISDEEIANIVTFIGEHAPVQFDEKLTRKLERIKEVDPSEELEGDEMGDDDDEADDPAPPPSANGIPAPAGMTTSKEDALYRQALTVLRDTKRASISHFQRRMGIGYNHAARIVDLLEERGVIGTTKGAGPREILLDPEALLAQMDGEAAPALPDGDDTAATDPLSTEPQPSSEDDPLAFPEENE